MTISRASRSSFSIDGQPHSTLPALLERGKSHAPLFKDQVFLECLTDIHSVIQSKAFHDVINVADVVKKRFVDINDDPSIVLPPNLMSQVQAFAYYQPLSLVLGPTARIVEWCLQEVERVIYMANEWKLDDFEEKEPDVNDSNTIIRCSMLRGFCKDVTAILADGEDAARKRKAVRMMLGTDNYGRIFHYFVLEGLLRKDPRLFLKSLRFLTYCGLTVDYGTLVKTLKYSPIKLLYEIRLDKINYDLYEELFLEISSYLHTSHAIENFLEMAKIFGAPATLVKDAFLQLLEHYSFPLHLCLKFAFSFPDQLQFYTGISLRLLESCPDKRTARIVLDTKNFKGETPLSLAIQSENAVFLRSEKVAATLQSFWKEPIYKIIPHTSQYEDTNGYNFIIQQHQEQAKNGGTNREIFWSLLPTYKTVRLKLLLSIVSYLIFLLLFSASLLDLSEFHSGRQFGREWVVLGMGICFWVHEFFEAKGIGISDYMEDEWNIIDQLMYLLFVVLFVFRLVSYNVGSSLAISVMLSLCAIFGWIRLFFAFNLISNSGPLLISVRKMVYDIMNFFFIGSIFMIGYSIAFYYLVNVHHSSIEGFSTVTECALSLFSAFAGEFDITVFYTLDDFSFQLTALILFGSYLIIASILLLNLLIAMMSQTYSSVQQSSNDIYVVGRAWYIVRTDKQGNQLPPPFGPVIFVLFNIVYILTVFLKKCYRCCRSGVHKFPQRPTNNWTCRYCYYFNTDDDVSMFRNQSIDFLISNMNTYCGNCWRNKNEISKYNMALEKCSYVIYICFFQVPFYPFYLFYRLLHAVWSWYKQRRISKESNSEKDELLERFHELANDAIINKRLTMQGRVGVKAYRGPGQDEITKSARKSEWLDILLK